MCKIFIATNTSLLTDAQMLKLIKATSGELTKGNDDGFGYSVATKDGFYGERFTDIENMHFAQFGEVNPNLGPVDEYVFSEAASNSFGVKAPHSGGLTLHARTSTNQLGLINTHPFVGERYSLIHNGIIENKGPEVTCQSGNDSEILLRLFEQGGIELLSQSAEGYYALGILDAHTGNTIVVRDSRASLYACWVAKLESYFFATTKEALKVALKSLKLKSEIKECKTNSMLTFNREGTLTEITSFTPRERSFGSLDAKSLGTQHAEYVGSREYWYAGDDDAPSYREEHNAYSYADKNGNTISESDFEELSYAEQSMCSVYQYGRKVS